MRHHTFGGGASFLRLDPGEEIVGTLIRFAEEHKIQAGWVTGLGSVDKVVLGFLDPHTNEYVRRRFEERMEVASLTGTFSMDGERPFVHVHAVVTPRELLAYGGHVHEAKVGAVVELVVQPLDGRLDRHAVEGSAMKVLTLPGEAPPDASGQAGERPSAR